MRPCKPYNGFFQCNFTPFLSFLALKLYASVSSRNPSFYAKIISTLYFTIMLGNLLNDIIGDSIGNLSVKVIKKKI